ncbi:GDP-mannose-dependent alpha-(1-6)-phosphatidylinositol monomannoside mannosyltransferase [Blastopirellula retiformator]|uniref:GDP-mannose-dependent alpha-(1-6)-phosphatidylinositol monomannoside mannosyltransferase n=2 Tax=Blastopirellula retiformator TaxID=2527970 RepID=A0A5C5V7M1_9BACT|nr:GDP-mannose-dependent alpha-(1-6)-phosphatidylinositol monomannoside mannosyltransferase [Blastopirellula retiformator]
MCERHKLPLVTSFYGRDASAIPNEEGWRARYKLLFQSGDAFIVEGPAMRERLVALECPPEKIHIVPLIFDGAYKFRERQLVEGEELKLVFVGRFVDKKGLPILLRALGVSQDKIGPFRLSVIGDGPCREEMEHLANELGIANRVVFCGYCSRDAMKSELEASHILVAPSRTAADGDTEGGAPTILVEAMAMGLPIASTTHADIPFVCSAYVDFLAEEDDVPDLADKIVRLRESHRQWPQLAQSALRHVQTQHSLENIEKLEDVYDLVSRARL